MFTVDSKTILVIGSTAASILASVYVLWGPSAARKKSRKGTCPGLVNLGNTCFLNALLQGIAPCSSVTDWLYRFIHKCGTTNKYLASTLQTLFDVLNNKAVEDHDELCASDLLTVLQGKGWVISSDEQDAHELFHVITSTLEEEAQKCPAVLSLAHVKMLQDPEVKYLADTEGVNNIRTRLPMVPDKDKDNPFRGLLASQLTCVKCAHKNPVKYDTFDSLSLPLINSRTLSMLTLEKLLKHYVSSETVDNVECDGCARIRKTTSKPRSTFVKKLTIGKLPRCLCIHLQRTLWQDNGMPRKRHDLVTFPEVLHMAPYVYQKKYRTAIPPTTLDLGNGLVGGKSPKNTHSHTKKKSPIVTSPYSPSVNLLKALNFHSRGRQMIGGLLIQPSVPSTRTAINHTNTSVEILAKSYEIEQHLEREQTNSYKLNSVVSHLGDVFSGHFVTYRRAPSLNGQQFPPKWLYCSDTLVEKCNVASVLNCEAYMLFYDRM